MINYFETTFDNQTVHMAEQKKRNFNAFITLINREIKEKDLDAYATLDTIYEDYGARMVWNTVIIHYTNNGYQSSYQALTPRQWEIINVWEDLSSIGEVLEEVMYGKYGVKHFCKD